MKNIKLYAVVTFALSAALYTQLTAAAPTPAPAQPQYQTPLATFHFTANGDDHDDESHDQCPLIFPFCEAF